jgi:Patatin-like phospholipase
MNGSDGDVPGDGKFFRILSLDGGGIRGVFPAAFLARLEEHLEHPIGRYFDLIAGTSTGGIIAIGLGLGLSAGDILKLYVEQGSAIFDQEHGAVKNWVRAKVRGMAHLFVTKHSSEPLRRALEGVLGRRRLGESRTRLVIPAWHPVLERVYIYKTAHHPRLETDYRQPAIDAAIATAAAPTFLKPHMTESAVELVDGGVWANNPIGVAAIEAIGMLGWPGDRLKILSIGTINEPGKLRRLRGKLPMVIGGAALHGRPGAQLSRHREDHHWRRPSAKSDLAHRSDGAGRAIHVGQCRPHFGDAGPRVRRSARAASGAQAAFLRRAGGRIRAVPCPLKKDWAMALTKRCDLLGPTNFQPSNHNETGLRGWPS